MTILVRVLSFLGLLAYCGFAFLLVAMSGMSASSTDPWTGPALFYLAIPFVYLVYCFVSSFRICTGLPLLISGIIAHITILPFIILSFRNGELPLFSLAGLVMAGAWTGMYFEKRMKSH